MLWADLTGANVATSLLEVTAPFGCLFCFTVLYTSCCWVRLPSSTCVESDHLGWPCSLMRRTDCSASCWSRCLRGNSRLFINTLKAYKLHGSHSGGVNICHALFTMPVQTAIRQPVFSYSQLWKWEKLRINSNVIWYAYFLLLSIHCSVLNILKRGQVAHTGQKWLNYVAFNWIISNHIKWHLLAARTFRPKHN